MAVTNIRVLIIILHKLGPNPASLFCRIACIDYNHAFGMCYDPGINWQGISPLVIGKHIYLSLEPLTPSALLVCFYLSCTCLNGVYLHKFPLFLVNGTQNANFKQKIRTLPHLTRLLNWATILGAR
jgi:hypothetical protein